MEFEKNMAKRRSAKRTFSPFRRKISRRKSGDSGGVMGLAKSAVMGGVGMVAINFVSNYIPSFGMGAQLKRVLVYALAWIFGRKFEIVRQGVKVGLAVEVASLLGNLVSGTGISLGMSQTSMISGF